MQRSVMWACRSQGGRAGVRFDLWVPGAGCRVPGAGCRVPVEMTRDELIVVVARQAGRIIAQDRQITAQAGQLAELVEVNEALAGKLARVEEKLARVVHLLSRNSGNSSMPPSKDDEPGKTPPAEKKRPSGGPKRAKGKQPGAPGSRLAWTETPDEVADRFPRGSCGCGKDLVGARDLGVIDRYQQHEIPRVAVRVTQYDQHQVECSCGAVHTATRPEGARSGPVGYGPNLQAFAVYLMVAHFLLDLEASMLQLFTSGQARGRVRDLVRICADRHAVAERPPPA